MTEDFQELLYVVEDGIATITLNRPDKLNTLTNRMVHELVAAFDLVDADDDVHAVIVTGAGRAFCGGADMSIAGADTFEKTSDSADPDAPDDTAALKKRDGGGIVTLRIFQCLKPVIGAVNGAAAGIGATMLLPMDARLASTDSKFGFVFVRRGIIPEACSNWFLPRLVGISQALEWCYRGDVFPAQEAVDGGLIKSLHEPDDLLPAARELAKSFVENGSAVSIAMTRQLMWRMLGASHPMEAHQVESATVPQLGAMADAKEGVMSFLEKRPAEFTLRPSTDMPAVYPWFEEPGFEPLD